MKKDTIEIGEYVRTKNGYILKNTIKEHKHIIDGIINQNEKYKYEFDNIEKHSKTIIDLIKVGDYVNGLLIEDIEIIDNKKVFYSNGEMVAWTNRDNGIKTILTKEQFEQNCYRLQE